jgi:2-amino-4-hydroxy-6-hydroxymethyldihydropteridine diphosphokinase
VILIALGSSLSSRAGTPAQTLHATIVSLREKGIEPVAISHFYATPAWPDPSDPPFVNAVQRVRTMLPPAALLAKLQDIERDFGRVRGARNAPRTLDLDIIDYDGRIETGPPELPHPRMASRGFVLIPLKDAAPDWRHPVSGRTIDELIAALPPDQRELQPVNDS